MTIDSVVQKTGITLVVLLVAAFATVADRSQLVNLPGDVLATGTNHRGLSGFQNGDKIELETDGLGRLRRE